MDRFDSRLLARLPMPHPDELQPETGLGPGDRLRRATRMDHILTMRRSQNLPRIEALLEILGTRKARHAERRPQATPTA